MLTGRAASRLLLFAACALGLSAFWMFTYNSGYGYDALEFLVIGRALHQGQALYAIVPSKSWGIYTLAGAVLSIPGAAGHMGVTTLVTLLSGACAIAVERVVSARFGARAAWLAAALTLLGAAFMELNYFEPEALVGICGVAAFAALTRRARPSAAACAGAGVWIGVGIAFKVVAGFYALGVIGWLAWPAVAGRVRPGETARTIAAFVAGVGAAVLLPAAYFALTGRLAAHLFWQYEFPLRYYPSNFEWLSKLYTKLLWVWAVLAGALLLARTPRVRQAAGADRRLSLLLWMGVPALAALLKTQASHYAFPAAMCFLIYAAVVFSIWVGETRATPRSLAALAAAAMCVGLSGLAYRPSAIARFTHLRSFDEEAAAAHVAAGVHDGRTVIFVTRASWLYWLTGDRPAWPVINTDVQTTYLVARNAAPMLATLDDPRLQLVVYDPASTTFDDPRFLDGAAQRRFVSALTCRLEQNFDRHDGVAPSLVVWTRRATATSESAHDCSS